MCMWQSVASCGAACFGRSTPLEFDTCCARPGRAMPAASAASEACWMKVRREIISSSVPRNSVRVALRCGSARALLVEQQRLLQQRGHRSPAGAAPGPYRARADVSLAVDQELDVARRPRLGADDGAREHRVRGDETRVGLCEHARVETLFHGRGAA